MASNLLPCPDCQHQVSPTAWACPSCGAELRKTVGSAVRSGIRGLGGAFLVIIAIGAAVHLLGGVARHFLGL
jgi:hypothetical protein